MDERNGEQCNLSSDLFLLPHDQHKFTSSQYFPQFPTAHLIVYDVLSTLGSQVIDCGQCWQLGGQEPGAEYLFSLHQMIYNGPLMECYTHRLILIVSTELRYPCVNACLCPCRPDLAQYGIRSLAEFLTTTH